MKLRICSSHQLFTPALHTSSSRRLFKLGPNLHISCTLSLHSLSVFQSHSPAATLRAAHARNRHSPRVQSPLRRLLPTTPQQLESTPSAYTYAYAYAYAYTSGLDAIGLHSCLYAYLHIHLHSCVPLDLIRIRTHTPSLVCTA